MTASSSPLLRTLLCLAMGVLGVALGAALSMGKAAEAESLVGGAIVALGAVIGGVSGLLVGALAAWKLPASRLPLITALLGLPALALLGLALRAAWNLDQQNRDPEEAYAGLPVFVAVLERDPANDPYLSPRVEVNAGTREWITTLPDGGHCRGVLRADVQRRLADALPATPVPAACRDAPAQGAAERLSWDVDGAGAAAILVDADCRAAAPRAEQLARLLSMASSLAASAASCDR